MVFGEGGSVIKSASQHVKKMVLVNSGAKTTLKKEDECRKL
jgi:hypothetical protein